MKRPFFIFISFIFTVYVSAQVRYTIIPDHPRPGDPITIGVDGSHISTRGIKEAVAFIDGREAAKSYFFRVPAEAGKSAFWAAVITLPSAIQSGEALIKLNTEAETIIEVPIIIAHRDFNTELIHLDSVNTGIRTDPSPQRTQEANLLWSILTTTGNQVYHTGSFVPPVEATRRTSHFGDRRVYVYSTGDRDTSVHAGIDYGVPTGTPVTACGAGRVVLARMRIVTGNTVVLEHAPSIYSLYYHMDSIDVQEGVLINTGTLLGTSGSTGLSTGPHLHWEIRVSSENTCPDAFVERPIIDKDLIISRIFDRYSGERR